MKQFEERTIEDLCYINEESLSGTTDDSFTFEYIDLGSVNKGRIEFDNKLINFKEAPSRARRIINKNEILMSNVRPNLQGFALYRDSKTRIASTGFSILKPKIDVSIEYIYQYLFSRHMINQINSLLVGSNYPAINTADVKNLIILTPSLEEQKKIANILSTWDRAIEMKQEAISYQKSLLSGLTKGLTKGYKKIEGFQESIWKNTSLDKVFIVRNEKKYISEELPLYSFTIEDGVTPKSDRYNREFLVKGNKKYKVSKYQDLVFNPANLKYGAIAVNDNKEDVLISPIYETLVIKDTNKYDIDFFKYLLTHSEMIGFYKSKVEGTLIERSAVKVDAFLLFQFDVPNVEEQRRIANILKTIDKSINLMQKEVETLKLQKKGLMQQLLTGKIRVQS